MKTQLKIILLFLTLMAMSFIPEYNHELFGDWLCQGSGKLLVTETGGYSSSTYFEKCNYFDFHQPEWHFGFRHWVWIAMGSTLTVLNFIWIFKLDQK